MPERFSPYNFVPLPPEGQPERKDLPGLRRLDEQGASGQLVCELEALTPLFTADQRRRSPERRRGAREPLPFLRNRKGTPIVQGTTLKGMIRAVYEAMTSSCLPLAETTKENKRDGAIVYRFAPLTGFHHDGCRDLKALCPACRLFGVIHGDKLHARGRVAFSDAELVEGKLAPSDAQFQELQSPKPQDYAIYSADGREGGPIRGRKLYYHHRPDSREAQEAKTEVAPQGSRFRFTATFENLEDRELERLLWCLCLDLEHGHKLGMAKPLGFGSCRIHVKKEESQVFAGASRYQGWGRRGKPPEITPWIPSPPELERLLRLDLHDGHAVGYLPLGGYKGMTIRPEDGEYVPVQGTRERARPPEEDAPPAPAQAPPLRFEDLLARPEESPARKPIRRGDRVRVVVVRVLGQSSYLVRPEEEDPEQRDIPVQGGGLNWSEGERRQVRVVELDARGKIKRAAP